MNAHDYFRHARSLGAFRAEDALALAREAVALDEAAKLKKLAPASLVSYELVDGDTVPVKLSFAVKVF